MTKDDILGFIGRGRSGEAAPTLRPPRRSAERAGAGDAAAPRGAGASAGARRRGTFKPGADDRVEKMSVMRKQIAEHMVLSRQTSAHVHSVFEVNFAAHREDSRGEEGGVRAAGAKLTYMSFIIKAVVDALRAVPILNASIDGDNIVYHRDINIGIAVALDWGLIVPVIKNADEKNMLGLSRAVADLANRARAQAAEAGRSARAARSRSPTPASSARCSARRSSTSRRSRSSASATSRSARSSSTMRSPSGRWRISPSATITA